MLCNSRQNKRAESWSSTFDFALWKYVRVVEDPHKGCLLLTEDVFVPNINEFVICAGLCLKLLMILLKYKC